MTVRTRPTVADRAVDGLHVGTELAHHDGLCTVVSDPVTNSIPDCQVPASTSPAVHSLCRPVIGDGESLGDGSTAIKPTVGADRDRTAG